MGKRKLPAPAAGADAPVHRNFYTHVALPVAVLWRIWLANRMPIMDCDEVYNYWEPLHFLLYGRGMQTWEYAHQYALRSYAYLLPLQGLARIYEWLLPSTSTTGMLKALVPLLMDMSAAQQRGPTVVVSTKFVLFLLLRCSLAACMARAEVILCRSLEERRIVSSPVVARWMLFVSLSSAGLAHAAGALLPSTTWTLFWLLTANCLVCGHVTWFVIYAVAATLAIGWPFGVVVLIPQGLYVLLVQTQLPSRGSSSESNNNANQKTQQKEEGWFSPGHRKRMEELVWLILFVTAAIQTMVMAIDYYYYGYSTSPNFQIFRYNAQAGGDELYGVEPTSYYIKNLLLNFNGVAILGLVSLPVVVLVSFLFSSSDEDNKNETTTSSSTSSLLLLLGVLLTPLYLWLALVVPRPHKEERFLFVIYPVLCIGAVLAWDGMVSIVVAGLGKVWPQLPATLAPHQSILHGLVWTPMAALSMMRIMALKKYYAAPLSIYLALHTQEAARPEAGAPRELVCTCGEWYRFPSSFTLPAHQDLGFLPSSFTGQLPQPFSQYGSSVQSVDLLQPFNDQNEGLRERYSKMEDCSYVIDLEMSMDCQAPSRAKVIATAPFLDAEKTTSTLHRTLYIPVLHEKAITEGTVFYQNYILYKL